jgi:GNAT superfamily N-acetyltransferase
MADLGFDIAPPLPHVSEFRPEDAEALAHCWREGNQAWPGGGPGGGLATAASVEAALVEWDTLAMFLAWAPDRQTGDERVVGYCWFVPYGPQPETGYVHILGVHQDYHGHGYGRDLLKAALARTVALGHRQLNLHTWPGNQKAVPLYKRSGYFWAPDTTVRMENYLPTIFKLPDARRFFAEADWYRDFRRPSAGALRQDDELYRYEWERDGRRLAVTIDRRARAIVALESPDRELSLRAPAGLLPVGSERPVVVRVASRQPGPVALVAEGRDGVELHLAATATVDDAADWTAPARVARAGDARVEATVVLDGQEQRLAATVRGCEPVAIELDRRRWLAAGLAQPYWVTVANPLEEPVAGELRLSAAAGLSVDRDALAFELGPREKASLRLGVCAARPGSYALRARARARLADGSERETPGVDGQLHCGEIGAVLVEQTPERVTLATDRLLVEAPLKDLDWGPRVNLLDRASGRLLLEHGCALGRPFWPAAAAFEDFTARVEPGDGAATLVLAATTRRPTGLAFEWRLRVAASGTVRLTYRVANLGSEPRPLQVASFTYAELEPSPTGQVAAPLESGLVVDDALGFPDWQEPSTSRPERYAEEWIALFGDGWAAGTIWSRAQEVAAWYSMPGLALDLGTVQPGGQVESAPVWLYAGPGDWRTVRSLWRQLVAPAAPAEDPRPRPSRVVRLGRFVGEADALETHLALQSERFRPLSGRVAVEVGGAGQEVAGGEFEGLRLGAASSVALRLPLPARVGASEAALVLDHEAGRERWPTALIRAGDGRSAVAVEAAPLDGVETVLVENGRLRLRLVPSQVGRAIELSVDGVDQICASWPDPGAFVRYSPWFGGLHPVLQAAGQGWWVYPGKLSEESFDWEPAERVGAQGIRWRGARLTNEPAAPELRGVRVTLEYLLSGGGNLLGLVSRVENRGRAPWRGRLELVSFLQPGGDRQRVELSLRRDGERLRRRVHGEAASDSEGWCAVAAPGGPALALVAAAGPARVAVWDVGLEGAHPYLTLPLDLEPGASADLAGYLVVADDLAQARLYRALGEQEGLV